MQFCKPNLGNRQQNRSIENCGDLNFYQMWSLMIALRLIIAPLLRNGLTASNRFIFQARSDSVRASIIFWLKHLSFENGNIIAQNTARFFPAPLFFQYITHLKPIIGTCSIVPTMGNFRQSTFELNPFPRCSYIGFQRD
jgi:hypothetical protein